MVDKIEALVLEVKSSMENIKEETKKIDEFVKAQVKENKDSLANVSKEQLAALDKMAETVANLSKRIIDSEQKLAENVIQGKAAPKTLGQLVIESDSFKQFAEGKSQKMHLDLNVQNNTITGQDGGSPPRNSNVIVAPDRQAGIIGGAFRTLKIRDAIPSGPTNSNAVEYTRENVFTNGAAETAEGDTKPQSTLTFELVNTPIRTIAHWLKVSKQVLDDAPSLATYIDNRLRYGVDLRIDTQLFSGNGSGQNLSGLAAGNNYAGFSPTAGETELDALNRMKYEVAAADYMASIYIVNPTTWGNVERLKGTDDHYIVGDPLNPFGPVLWGLPVVVSNAVPAGKAYCAAMEVVAEVAERSGTVVEMFEQDETNVQKNLLTVRAEARLALKIYRPVSARYGALVSPGASS